MGLSQNLRLTAGILLCLGISASADTFTVTTTAPTGPGSLTEAINSANANPSLDTIAFDIPGSGVQTIPVGDINLPEITEEVIIDGYTQPGASANTLTTGDDAVILIRIDGTQAMPSPKDGLVVSASNSVIRGLALTGFVASSAIVLTGLGSNVVAGNYIGMSPDAFTEGSNGFGVSVSGSANIIGGVLPGDRNVISHNDVGIHLLADAEGNVVEGNYLGTDPSGTIEIANTSTGIFIEGSANQIGFNGEAAANLIAGGDKGIDLFLPASANAIDGNLIGSDVSGTHDFGAASAGIVVSGTNNNIGTVEGGNRIWCCPRGVVVQAYDGAQVTGNSILSNSIYAPALSDGSKPGDPIDLDVFGNFDGPTRNDLGDGDTGPNNLQNFPIITSTSFLSDRTTVRGGLNSTPSATFTIQLYARDLTEGTLDFLANVLDTETITTNAAGQAYFTFDLPPLPFDLVIIATVTDAEGNTSEFSNQDTVQLANISTRGQVGIGDDILISGFVVHRPPGGPADYTKEVLLRALGPSLTVDGVPLAGRLENPTLELHDASGAVLASNDDWRSDQEAEIIATGAAPSSDAEAALIADLPDGTYTVQVRGANGIVGLGVTEVYDLEPLDPINEPVSGRLVNISTRGLVGTGDEPLIGGLIVNGDDAEHVLIRAIGPDLIGSVPNALEDPTLEVRDGSGALLASNDNWRDEQEAEIAATGIAPNDDRDAAVLFSLIPGSYTAIVRGKADSTGVGLVEVYDLNPDH